MELLVYVRNHGGRKAGSTYVGASVGEAPMLERLEMREPLTSSAEFRVEGCIADPVGELRSIVEQLFEMIRDDKFGRAIYIARQHSAIRVVLEPGFETAFDVTHDLAEMLVRCAPQQQQQQQPVSPMQSAGFLAPAPL